MIVALCARFMNWIAACLSGPSFSHFPFMRCVMPSASLRYSSCLLHIWHVVFVPWGLSPLVRPIASCRYWHLLPSQLSSPFSFALVVRPLPAFLFPRIPGMLPPGRIWLSFVGVAGVMYLVMGCCPCLSLCASLYSLMILVCAFVAIVIVWATISAPCIAALARFFVASRHAARCSGSCPYLGFVASLRMSLDSNPRWARSVALHPSHGYHRAFPSPFCLGIFVGSSCGSVDGSLVSSSSPATLSGPHWCCVTGMKPSRAMCGQLFISSSRGVLEPCMALSTLLYIRSSGTPLCLAHLSILSYVRCPLQHPSLLPVVACLGSSSGFRGVLWVPPLQ